jgi:hypothetical protein
VLYYWTVLASFLKCLDELWQLYPMIDGTDRLAHLSMLVMRCRQWSWPFRYMSTPWLCINCHGEAANKSVPERKTTSSNVPNFHAPRDADAINKYTLRTGRSCSTSSEVYPCSQPLRMGWWPTTIFQDAVDSVSAESRSWGT